MNKLITISLLLLISMVAKAQDFQYTYDENGNRTQRQIIALKTFVPDTTQAIIEDSLLAVNTTNNVEVANAPNNNSSNTPNNANLNGNNPTPKDKYQSNLGNQNISIYPNPTRGELKVDISNFAIGSKGSILVIDMLGKTIFKSESINASNIINLSGVASGKYIMRLVLDGKSNEWVIVKE